MQHHQSWSVEKLWMEGDQQPSKSFGSGRLSADWDEAEPGHHGAVRWSFDFVTPDHLHLDPGDTVRWLVDLGRHPDPPHGDTRYRVVVSGFVRNTDGTGHSVILDGRPHGLIAPEVP